MSNILYKWSCDDIIWTYRHTIQSYAKIEWVVKPLPWWTHSICPGVWHNSLPVKSTRCCLCCLPLIVLSLSFTRLAVFFFLLFPNYKHKTLSLDHHWLGSNDFWNCFVSPSLSTHVTDVVWVRMAACQNQAWRAISNWADCVRFGLFFHYSFLLEGAE